MTPEPDATAAGGEPAEASSRAGRSGPETGVNGASRPVRGDDIAQELLERLEGTPTGSTAMWVMARHVRTLCESVLYESYGTGVKDGRALFADLVPRIVQAALGDTRMADWFWDELDTAIKERLDDA